MSHCLIVILCLVVVVSCCRVVVVSCCRVVAVVGVIQRREEERISKNVRNIFK